MKKETLNQRLAELDLAAQQGLANYNALLGAKQEVQNLINYLDAVEQKEKLEAEIKDSESKLESPVVNACLVGDECSHDAEVANGN
jgi:hypothetical protein